MEVGREPDSVVLVPTDLADIPLLDFVVLVRSLTRAPVLAGLSDGYDAASLGSLIEHGIAATVTLPVTPSRLAAAAAAAHHPPAPEPVVLRCGSLELDEGQHRVRWRGNDVRLSPKEFDILRHVMAAHPTLVTVQQLVGHFEHGDDDRAARVRVAVRRVRAKLHAAAPHHPSPLVNVHSLGYRLEP
jgi:two-component system KDP operon response regulator KdpE